MSGYIQPAKLIENIRQRGRMISTKYDTDALVPKSLCDVSLEPRRSTTAALEQK